MPFPSIDPIGATQEKKLASARRRAWERGDLSWKFAHRPMQLAVYRFIRQNWRRAPYTVVLTHRRQGKSTVGISIGIEEMLKKRNARMAVIAQSKENAEGIIDEVIEPIIHDAPPAQRPTKVKNEFAYHFENGSRITIFPVNMFNRARGRGRRNDFVMFDEAGFINDLRYFVASIFGPSTREPTGQVVGSMLLTSTRPDEPDHDFDKMFDLADADGRAFKLPLSQNTEAVPSFIADCEAEHGGRDTVGFRREYECERIFDTSSTVIPEATIARLGGLDGRAPLVREIPRPGWVERYTSLDIGVNDPTGSLWGFYDAPKDLLVIEDELFMHDMTLDQLAVAIEAKEAALWAGANGPIRRYADPSNKKMVYDLGVSFGLHYLATDRNEKDAQIENLRRAIREGKIAIHPRCKVLVRTMMIARRTESHSWNRGYERQKEIGHADLLDCLLYMNRNVSRKPPDGPPPTVVHPAAFAYPEIQQRTSRRNHPLVRAFGLGRFRRG